MEIKVNLFAALRDGAGVREVHLPWKHGMTSSDVLAELRKKFQSLTNLLEHSFVAVNGIYAESKCNLMPADEVVVLPPMSGG